MKKLVNNTQTEKNNILLTQSTSKEIIEELVNNTQTEKNIKCYKHVHQENLGRNRAKKHYQYAQDLEHNRAKKRCRYIQNLENNRAIKRRRCEDELENNRIKTRICNLTNFQHERDRMKKVSYSHKQLYNKRYYEKKVNIQFCKTKQP